MTLHYPNEVLPLPDVPFIDFHNHNIWHTDDVIEVVSVHDSQEKKKVFYTLGFHPWWTENLLSLDQLDLMRSAYLNDPYCLGLGEFGLDNLKGASLDIQKDIFCQQINVANEVSAPVVVHCVRAYDRIIRLRKELGKTLWVIHGYVRNRILARQLIDAGFYLSVAPHDRMKPVFEDMLVYVPLDRVFLETDSEFTMNIQQRYTIFAEIRKMDVTTLKLQLFDNFKTFYANKWKHLTGSKGLNC